MVQGQTPVDPPHDDDPPAKSILNLKIYLEGYYLGSGQMQPVLMNQGIGSNSTDTDNITVELRKSTDGTLRASKNVILKTNGTVTVDFDGSVIGNYFVVVKHRSSIQTWSSGLVTLNPLTVANYDFSTAASTAYGNNLKEIENGVFVVYGGDFNQDDIVDFFDNSVFEQDYDSFAIGYYNTDLNGDGIVDFFDYTIFEFNLDNFIYALYPTF